jgi:hypothetical protein
VGEARNQGRSMDYQFWLTEIQREPLRLNEITVVDSKG